MEEKKDCTQFMKTDSPSGVDESAALGKGDISSVCDHTSVSKSTSVSGIASVSAPGNKEIIIGLIDSLPEVSQSKGINSANASLKTDRGAPSNKQPLDIIVAGEKVSANALKENDMMLPVIRL